MSEMPQDGEAGAPTTAQGQGEATPDGSTEGWLQTVLKDILVHDPTAANQERFKSVAEDIQQRVQDLLTEEEAVTRQAEEEQAEVDRELARVASLVNDFRMQVERFLSSGGQ